MHTMPKGCECLRLGSTCLACHGSPKGEIDITGYPKEGANEGDLGGVISITQYQ